MQYPINATDLCEPCSVPAGRLPGRELSPQEAIPRPALANQIKVGCAGCIESNGFAVGIAMTENRIRIGCTEITAEAARLIMEAHALRFPKLPEYVMQ